MKYLLFLLIALAMIYARCISIEGNLGGLTSNRKKIVKEHPELFLALEGDLCAAGYSGYVGHVVPIKGAAFQHCLAEIPRALVYFWQPNCSSAACLSLNEVQRRAKLDDYQLFVIAEYYDFIKQSLSYEIDRPVFGIDTKYYRSELTNRYSARFFRDLQVPHDSIALYMQFNMGKLVRSATDIQELNLRAKLL